MAQLSGGWLIQQIDGLVILSNQYYDEEVVRFDPSDANECAKAQKTIYDSKLSAEDKCFAHFWSGYFYRSACGD